ncbi:MAG: PEP-CTERM sorting domain-containing protein [Armatimonadetes bacterium]|nr:PEP-CTERM sorting domain-containing protein [Armatimonadota bacterium]
MKTNVRSFAAVCGLLLGAVAHGQNSRFYFGYGDSQTAALNGHAVGDEISTANYLKVQPGGHFKVQVWVEKTGGGVDDLSVGLSTHIAYDRGRSSNAGDSPESVLMHRKLAYGGSSLTASVSNRASFANWDRYGNAYDEDSDGAQDVTTLRIASSQLRGEYQTGTGPTERRMGFGGQFVLTGLQNLGAFFKIGAMSTKVRLFDFELTNTLGYGEIYGDDGLETGLSLTPKATDQRQAGAQTYLATRDEPDIHQSTLGSQLIVQAVPEPSGMLALGLGALIFLRRKK